MEINQTELEGLLLIKPEFFEDFRGRFMETYNALWFSEILSQLIFVQDNESVSHKDVIRGLHFQVPPYAQGKLVRVSRGAVLDVVVDLRTQSKTYGKHTSVILSDHNKLQLWIPPGFAHGFLSLEDNTVFNYKCTKMYNRESERSIFWNDADLKIQWGVSHPVISEKDQQAQFFNQFSSPF